MSKNNLCYNMELTFVFTIVTVKNVMLYSFPVLAPEQCRAPLDRKGKTVFFGRNVFNILKCFK